MYVEHIHSSIKHALYVVAESDMSYVEVPCKSIINGQLQKGLYILGNCTRVIIVCTECSISFLFMEYICMLSFFMDPTLPTFFCKT